MNQNNNSIWDDSLCTVDESISAEAVSLLPKPTIKFTNCLIANKGDIKTARKISGIDTILLASKCQSIESSSEESVISSSSINDDDLIEVIDFSRIKANSATIKHQLPVSSKPWEDLEEQQIMMDSEKILKQLSCKV